jgi:hypothetical protein
MLSLIIFSQETPKDKLSLSRESPNPDKNLDKNSVKKKISPLI